MKIINKALKIIFSNVKEANTKPFKDERWSVGCPPVERRTGRGRGALQQEDKLRLGEGEGLARGVQQLLRPHRPVSGHQREDNHLQRVPQPTEASILCKVPLTARLMQDRQGGGERELLPMQGRPRLRVRAGQRGLRLETLHREERHSCVETGARDHERWIFL